MNNVQYAFAIANANWNSINNLLGCSGSCGVNGINPYSVPSDYMQSHLLQDDPMIKIINCKHCNQAHRIDESKLDAITVLDCQKCGGSLI